MKKIVFGFNQFKTKTPDFIHWISVSGATLLTVMAGMQQLYPLYITDHMISETAKMLAAVRLIGQFFGVKETKNEETT